MAFVPSRKTLLLVAALAVAGCATPPVRQPTTTVILMPDEDGRVGAVSVSTAAGTTLVDEAFASSTVVGTRAPSSTTAMGNDAVESGYATLLKAQPPKPASFILYFQLDRTTLTDESKALIPAVVAAARERKPTEISIFGHTDSIGTERRNTKLSADRATVIANLLKKEDPGLDHIQTQFFGDKLPLVPSGARAEPRNRRAEIQIL